MAHKQPLKAWVGLLQAVSICAFLLLLMSRIDRAHGDATHAAGSDYDVGVITNVTLASGLKYGFYQDSCPGLAETIWSVLCSYVDADPTLAASLLRLHFHDAIVQGVDASVLLNSTTNNTAEKDVVQDLSLRGYFVIDAIKSEVENLCPETVSCADILAIVARDSTYLANGPYWHVPTGRRDGNTSSNVTAFNSIPSPFEDFDQLTTIFENVGLTMKDLVVLSGAHTIGKSHCFNINSRLYNFTGKGDSDPSLDAGYVTHLKSLCAPGNLTAKIDMEPLTPLIFDGNYYTGILANKGLFTSDATFLTNATAKAYLNAELTINGSSHFFTDFAASMVSMSQIGVLTGTQGEVRLNCALVNS